MRCTVAVLVLSARGCVGAGTNLWSLGAVVDENPITTFFMFGFAVFLVAGILALKQYIENRTADEWRTKALDSFYVELMLVGVISFLLLISAELGLTDLRIDFGGCDEETANSSESGSGSSACGVGFDLLMFEYAHLVLFIMGLTYGAFIQLCFWYRNTLVSNLRKVQEKTLGEYIKNGGSRNICSPFGAVGLAQKPWSRSILIMRGIIALQHEEKLKKACNKKEHQLEHAIAVLEGVKPPADFPNPEDALVKFDFAKLAEISMSEVLLEMLHVPPFVWVSLLFIASANLLHRAGVSLSDAITVTAFVGPLVSLAVLWRLVVHLFLIVRRGCGHSGLAAIQFHSAEGSRPYSFAMPEKYVHSGLAWATGGPAPWDIITGCIPDDSQFNCLDPLDAGNIKMFIQASIMMLCFYYGQLTMLTSMIGSESGGLVILLYLMPIPSLAFVLPHSIFIFTMVHRMRDPPIHWLKYALREPEEEDDDESTKSSEEEELQVTINSQISPMPSTGRKHRQTLVYQAGMQSVYSDEAQPPVNPLTNARRGRSNTAVFVE